jgi:hypothetical protein
MTPVQDDRTWQQTELAPRDNDLLSPLTQIVSDRDAYLGQSPTDIGRRVGPDKVEFFITGDIPGSLQAQFVKQQPEFIALHDIGGNASLKLLASLADASQSKVQQLIIRRQGHGVSLGALQFVEVPLAGGSVVRLYATDISADGPTRQHVARVLMGYSQLGVLLVGDLAPHVLTSQLAHLREGMQRGAWPNRDQLMIPVGSNASLAGQAAHLAQGTRVAVQVTPQASRPRQAWNFIAGAWNRLHEDASSPRALQLEQSPQDDVASIPSAGDTEHLPLRPATAAPAAPATPRAASGLFQPSHHEPLMAAPPPPMARSTAVQAEEKSGAVADWRGYAVRCGAIKGVVTCCVFDVRRMLPLASLGHTATPERLAQQGAALLSVMNEAPRALGMTPPQTSDTSPVEGVVSVPGYHLLVRPVPGHPGVAVHLVLTAGPGAATLARMQLERVPSPPTGTGR